MFEPRTMRALAAMRPLRVICECEIERIVEVAEKHFEMTVEAYARALRCSRCGLKGGKTFIGTIRQPEKPAQVIDLWAHPEALRKPRQKTSMVERGFALVDAQQRATLKALYPDIEERIAEKDRWRKSARLIRAMLGWSNDPEPE